MAGQPCFMCFECDVDCYVGYEKRPTRRPSGWMRSTAANGVLVLKRLGVRVLRLPPPKPL